jgi:integrase
LSKETTKTRLNKISDRNLKLPVKQIIDSFILLKKANGIAERTESDYKKYLGSFFKDSNTRLPEYTELKEKVISHFSKYSQLAPATYNLQYAYLNCFFEWCKEQGYIQNNPIKDAGIKKRKDKVI